MTASDSGAMNAAFRLRQYKLGVERGEDPEELGERIYGKDCLDVGAELEHDDSTLLDWAASELIHRERESSDRAKPINATILADSGGASIGTAWFWPGVPGRYESGVWMIGHEKIRDVRNHGDLIDVLKVLKGESK
jgi:hypothetical protein